MLIVLFTMVEAENHLNAPQLRILSEIFNIIGKSSAKKKKNVVEKNHAPELETEQDMDAWVDFYTHSHTHIHTSCP